MREYQSCKKNPSELFFFLRKMYLETCCYFLLMMLSVAFLNTFILILKFYCTVCMLQLCLFLQSFKLKFENFSKRIRMLDSHIWISVHQSSLLRKSSNSCLHYVNTWRALTDSSNSGSNLSYASYMLIGMYMYPKEILNVNVI